MADEKATEIVDEKTEEQAADQPQPEEQDAAAGGSGEGAVLDKHGQVGINKERHDREIAAKDAEIAKLKEQIEAYDGKQAAELKAQIEQLQSDLATERTVSALEKAGCIDTETAQAVIGKFGGDVAKLKEAKPFLFEIKKKGATGGKPAGAADGKDALEQRFREAAGLRKTK